MRRRSLSTAVPLAALLLGIAAPEAGAHAGLTASHPAAGAELGASPTEVTLTFSEQPEASLSEIAVLDDAGAPRQRGRPQQVSGDPLSLTVQVPRLERGVYTVDYRTVSAVDGHATAGTYAFGVRASPSGVAAVTSTASMHDDTSTLEVIARWLLLLGLVALIGAAVAGAARFGGSAGTDLALAAGGWMTAVIGLVLLAVAQRRAAGSSLGDLLDTAVGEALVWRAVALAVAGLALLVARRAPRLRNPAMIAAAACGLVAVAVHVGAGHAAAGGWSDGLTVSVQVAHFAAVGVWFGGLAALLLGVRGAPTEEKAAAVRSFSVVALGAFLLVLVTGTVRAVDELGSWGELVDTGYGRAVLAKVILIAIIFALAMRNRRRSVPVAAADLSPLRRTSRVELAVAAGALVAAALLGALAPPVTGHPGAAPGLSASGADFGTTVRVVLTAASDEPGPNRFVVEVTDYDIDEPVDADRVSLRFRSLDDPSVPPSSLTLRQTGEGTYAANGSNLSLDGRWELTALVERGGDSVGVPLQVALPFDEPVMSVSRLPDQAPEYTLQVENGLIRIVPTPERAGPSSVYVSLFGTFDNRAAVGEIVVTGAAGDGLAEEKPVRRLTRSRFVADLELEAGPYTITVVARTLEGNRLRGALELDVPD